MIYKTLDRKQKIEQHESPENCRLTQVLWNGSRPRANRDTRRKSGDKSWTTQTKLFEFV